jgi:hypothetical protein
MTCCCGVRIAQAASREPTALRLQSCSRRSNRTNGAGHRGDRPGQQSRIGRIGHIGLDHGGVVVAGAVVAVLLVRHDDAQPRSDCQIVRAIIDAEVGVIGATAGQLICLISHAFNVATCPGIRGWAASIRSVRALAAPEVMSGGTRRLLAQGLPPAVPGTEDETLG